MVVRKTVWALLCVLVLIGCADDPYEVDTSSVDYHPEFLRLDRAVFDLPESPQSSDILALKDSFSTFADIYLEDIMRVGPIDNPMTADLFDRFVSDPVWRKLQSVIERAHPSLDAEAGRIGEALRRYAVHFDADTLPQPVAYNSGFNIGIYPTDQWLGVGLEWYSGSDHAIIDRLPPELFPQYKRDKMKPRYLVPNAVKGWLMVRFAEGVSEKDLLGQMVYYGKVMFITSALLPDVPDADLLNYTEDQMAWSRNNEFDVWKHFVENDLVFSKDGGQINKILGDGPFTPGMPPESPGGIGVWVGYQMVKAYMDRHPRLSLKELMAVEEDRAFLQTYKPGK